MRRVVSWRLRSATSGTPPAVFEVGSRPCVHLDWARVGARLSQRWSSVRR